MPVCIAGMHRSGTSMVAKVLHEGGVSLGDADDLMPADAHNVDGYWENLHFVQLNDNVLNELGAAWDTMPTGQPDWSRIADSPRLRPAADTLLETFTGKEPWAWKDPRNSLTLPFWQALLPELKVIVCVRNPLEVAVSMRRRTGCSYAFGFSLWTEYNRQLLGAIGGSPALFVHYASVLANPGHEIPRLLNFAAADASVNTVACASVSAQEQLRHTRFGAADLRRAHVPVESIALYDRLCQLAGWSDGDEAEPVDRDAAGDDALDISMLEEVLRRSQPDTPWPELAARDQWTRDLQLRISRRQAVITRLEQTIAVTQSTLAAQRSDVERLESELNAERARSRQLAEATGRWRRRAAQSRRFLARVWYAVLRRIRRRAAESYGKGKRFLRRLAQPTPARTDAPAAIEGEQLNASAQAQSYAAALATALKPQSREYVALADASTRVIDPAVKLLAFYLPQFHPIPENDAWWGKGFTEWVNVTRAVPQFVGHYQPHLPGELGFYDLRVPEVQRRQVELARQYGISGFCFYYYWFAGRRLLEHPLRQFMADDAIDFPFCVCWANENWTRRWDGLDDEILISQDHSEATDAAFIRDLAPILGHRNYVRIHGRPVVIVYRVQLLANPVATTQRWREYCRQAGIGDLYLIAAEVFDAVDPRDVGFDAAIEFPPNTPGPRRHINRDVVLANPDYAGWVYRYADLAALAMTRPRPPYQLFRTVCPGWDNEPRRPGRGSTFAFSSPGAYGAWLEDACHGALADPDPEQRLVFINAWNEWAEGAHLEPDRRFGYAYLQETLNVVGSLRRRPQADWMVLFITHDANRGGAQRVLLNTLAWLRRHTSIGLKVLCLESGEWLPQFRELADTILEADLQAAAGRDDDAGFAARLKQFCGGAPDLIYANSTASGRVLRSLEPLGAPIITHVHELETSVTRYAGSWIRDIVERSRHFVACSNAVRDNLVGNHGVDEASISVVHSSIAANEGVARLPDDDARVSARRALGLPESKYIVFGCGIGMPFRKGADRFIQLAREVRELGRADVQFCWIGDFNAIESDPELGVWGDYVNRLGAEGSAGATFLGLKDDPRPYLRAGDLFVLPSREDPFPLVALEAAQCGLPIMCFADSGGIPEFIEADAGRVIAAGDLTGMAREIIALLDDPDRRQTMGDRAREKALARYTVDHTVPHVLSVCRSVARKPPAVSVIVPSYNHARYLRRRLDSIFDQTCQDFEVIVLDDASTDESAEILSRYRDRADVQIVVNDSNSGSPFKQWLRGIDLARADILWIAESDDWCDPEFLETLLPAFRDPAVKLAYANSHVVDEGGEIVGDYLGTDYLASLSATKWKTSYQLPAEQEINDGLGIKNTILSASAALWRRFDMPPAIRETLGQMRVAGDWYCHLHAIEHGEVHYSAKKLNYHRRHAESVIGTLLSERRITEFFEELARVHHVVAAKYPLSEEFGGKWERYLRDQWRQFCPDRPFADISRSYPVERIRGEIAAASGAVASDGVPV